MRQPRCLLSYLTHCRRARNLISTSKGRPRAVSCQRADNHVREFHYRHGPRTRSIGLATGSYASFHSRPSKDRTMASGSYETLYEEVKRLMPDSLRDNGWYLVTASSLVACGKPAEVANLYTYIVEKERPHLRADPSPDGERALMARFSDLLMKEWTLVGIPIVIGAITALAKVERPIKPEDVKLGETRQNIDMNKTIPEKGTKLLENVYRENLEPILSTWGSMRKDFEWLEKSVIYGLFLADDSVLNPVEAVLVSLPAIMCQGLGGATIWHLRGLRRLGCSAEEVEGVQRAVEAVAVWAGRSTAGWPRVTDIKDEI